MRNTCLIAVTLTALLTFAASAQQQARSDSGPSVPDAPQPQKKPAAKTPPATDAPADSSSKPGAQPKQPPAKDDNAFPEDVSQRAAKAATQPDSGGNAGPSGGAAHDNPFPEETSERAAKAATQPDSGGEATPSGKTANDNPFPEGTSREAAKAARDQQEPAAGGIRELLPPGVSSSQSSRLPGDGEPAPPVNDPARAKQDSEVGGFYLASGNYQGALLRYRDATIADPTNVDAIFGLAEAQRMLGKSAEAALNYQAYLDIVPKGPKAKQALKALKALRPGN